MYDDVPDGDPPAPLTADEPRIGPASGGAVRQLVILCHGYGANAHQQVKRAQRLSLALPDAVIFCPDAHSPIKDDPTKRRWFANKGVTTPPPPLAVEKAVGVFNAIIDVERARYGGPPGGYALIGFSQGGSMALASGLTRSDPPCALIAYAGLLPFWRRDWESITARPPTLILNGYEDKVVPLVMAQRTVEILRGAGVPVQAEWLPGVAHAIGDSGLYPAVRFLRRHFKAAAEVPA